MSVVAHSFQRTTHICETIDAKSDDIVLGALHAGALLCEEVECRISSTHFGNHIYTNRTMFIINSRESYVVSSGVPRHFMAMNMNHKIAGQRAILLGLGTAAHARSESLSTKK